MPAAVCIKIRGVEIGRITPTSRYLDKTAFLSLRYGERCAAYLALVWPATRSAQTLERVCRLGGSCHSITRELRRVGAIQIVSVGQYQLNRELSPISMCNPKEKGTKS
jgi:hypothetical protein